MEFWIIWTIAAVAVIADAVLSRAGTAWLFRCGPAVWTSHAHNFKKTLPARIRVPGWATFFPHAATPDIVLMREAIGFGSLNQFQALKLCWVRTEASAGRLEARLSIASLVTFAAVALASVQRPIVVAAYPIVAIAAFVQMASYRRLTRLLAAGDENCAPGADP